MKLKSTAAAMFACCLLTGPASAAPSLASFSATPSSTTVNQANSLTLAFTSHGNFSALGFIDLKLPSTFTVANPTGNCSPITVTVDGAPAAVSACGGGGGEIYTRITNPIPNGAAVRVIYSSSLITNPAAPGSYPFRVETTSGGVVIGEASATLSIAAPAPIPTLSEWAMIAMGLALAGGAALFIQRRRLAV